MIRAGLFIGVDQTGDLQKLKDAAAGAKRMQEWAIAQGMVDPPNAKLITDANGNKVGPFEIYQCIEEIIDGPGVDQLIVYFAGHGVNNKRGERWLLSDAPRQTAAAVNMKGSVDAAQYCGIKHVVFISDACRVAPEGIQANNVEGIEIFPNDIVSDSNPVDQFFACGIGRPAAELKDPQTAADNYRALYTEALLFALKGGASETFIPEPPVDPHWRYVSPALLRDWLAVEVPNRALNRGLAGKVNQNPNALVIASPYWISRVPRVDEGPTPPPPAPTVPPTPERVTQALLDSVIRGTGVVDRTIRGAGLSRLASEISRDATTIEADFGPDHFETECGIKVRGASVTDAFALRVRSIGRLDDHLVRIESADTQCVSVLLAFDNNTCAVVPALHGYLAGLTFTAHELIDVAYEPAANNERWYAYQPNMQELRQLRAVIAAATYSGYFRLENDNASELAGRMRHLKGIDPTLSVYAAYGYYDLQRRDIIRDMLGYLENDIGGALFDVMLLARKLLGKAIDPQDHIVPFFPLLSQGWALLKANRVKRHPVLERVEPAMKNSLWTLFDGGAFDSLRKTMESGEVL
jgi:hypothetical protein